MRTPSCVIGSYVVSLAIRHGLHHCDMGDAIIFLDLPGDRYFQLIGVSAERFRRFLAGERDDAVVELLTRSGILVAKEAGPESRLSSIELPRSSVLDEAGCQPAGWLMSEILMAQFLARQRLRRRPLIDLLDAFACRREGDASGPSDWPDRVRQVASAFQRSKRFINSTDQCLSRSLAMMAVLARRGCHPTMVIGVSYPFAAHCWVQLGTTVLSDSLDRVRSFKPILAV